jgi:anaerobic magnesium-protoporphyrin IX monomethyl ester cyclase
VTPARLEMSCGFHQIAFRDGVLERFRRLQLSSGNGLSSGVSSVGLKEATADFPQKGLQKLTDIIELAVNGDQEMGLQVVCVYTVDTQVTHSKPLKTGSEIPFGIALIVTVLKETGHEVITLVLARDTPFDQILDRTLRAVEPRMFCMTSVSTQFRFISSIAEKVKTVDPRIYVVVGGHHASMNPEEVMASAWIDAICLGEGEKAVVDLADRLQRGEEPSGIQNLWLKRAGANVVEKNPLAPFNEDLDMLPFIDREMWRPWIEEPDFEPAILVGRGCPNNCSYCSNHALRKLTRGRYVRFRSPHNVIAEVDRVCKNQSITSIYLEVETLSANLQYAFDLCEALAAFNSSRETPIRFHVNVALASRLMRDHNRLDELLQAFVRANLMTIVIPQF